MEGKGENEGEEWKKDMEVGKMIGWRGWERKRGKTIRGEKK